MFINWPGELSEHLEQAKKIAEGIPNQVGQQLAEPLAQLFDHLKQAKEIAEREAQYQARLEDKDLEINQLLLLLDQAQEKLDEAKKIYHLGKGNYNEWIEGNYIQAYQVIIQRNGD